MTTMTASDIAAFMAEAVDEARTGVRNGHGGPFGAVIVRAGVAVAKAHNTVLKDGDPTCHAEVNAIRSAAKALGAFHLDGCALIATSEPCPMCLAAAYWAGIRDIRFGVPRSVAAEAGFDDDLIYTDLARPLAERRVRMVHEAGLQADGERVFAEWRAAGGNLY